MDDLNKRLKERFPVGLRGVFIIKPFFKTVVKDKFFITAVLVATIIDGILFFYTEKQIYYIDMINDLVIFVIPALLGLSLAGFAIVVSQVSQDSLDRMADLDIEEENNYSLYQKLNAVFSITVLAQLAPLIIAALVKLIKPLSIEIPVSSSMAIIGNAIVLFIELMFFLYALLSIIDLVKNIFNTGQTVNFIVIRNKLKNKI